MLVKTPSTKCRPAMRSCTMLWLLTSMKQCVTPAASISAISSFRRTGSGVVCVAGITVLLMRTSTVEIKPHLKPSAR